MVHLNYTSGRIIAAARALAGMTQAELAGAANISVSTLKRMEGSGFGDAVGLPNNVKAVIAALEANGIIFEENDVGPGIRFRQD